MMASLTQKPVLDSGGNPVLDEYGIPRMRDCAQLHVPVDFAAMDEAGNPTDEALPFAPSLPSPKVDIADASISAIIRGPSGILRGTVTIEGTVSSAVCDTLPSAQGGTIDEVKLYVNGAPEPEATIPLAVWKGTGTTLGKPFPYRGAFAVSRPNVPITEGKNVFKVCAADKLYGIPGFGAWQVNVSPNYAAVATPDDHGISMALPLSGSTLLETLP